MFIKVQCLIWFDDKKYDKHPFIFKLIGFLPIFSNNYNQHDHSLVMIKNKKYLSAITITKNIFKKLKIIFFYQ